MASIDTRRPRGSRTLAGADRAGGGSGMCRSCTALSGREVVHLGVEDGGLDDLREQAARRLEDRGEVGQGLLGLGLDALGDDPRDRVDADRAGTEHEVPGDDGLAVGALRCGRPVGRDGAGLDAYLR